MAKEKSPRRKIHCQTHNPRGGIFRLAGLPLASRAEDHSDDQAITLVTMTPTGSNAHACDPGLRAGGRATIRRPRAPRGLFMASPLRLLQRLLSSAIAQLLINFAN